MSSGWSERVSPRRRSRPSVRRTASSSGRDSRLMRRSFVCGTNSPGRMRWAGWSPLSAGANAAWSAERRFHGSLRSPPRACRRDRGRQPRTAPRPDLRLTPRGAPSGGRGHGPGPRRGHRGAARRSGPRLSPGPAAGSRRGQCGRSDLGARPDRRRVSRARPGGSGGETDGRHARGSRLDDPRGSACGQAALRRTHGALQSDRARGAPARPRPSLHRDAPAWGVHRARHRRGRRSGPHDPRPGRHPQPGAVPHCLDRLGRGARPGRQGRHRQRAPPLRKRLRRQCDREPDQHRAGAQAAGLRVRVVPVDRLRPPGRGDLHAPAIPGGAAGDRARADRGGERGASPGRAARLSAERARGGRARRDRRGGAAGAGDGPPGGGTDRRGRPADEELRGHPMRGAARLEDYLRAHVAAGDFPGASYLVAGDGGILAEGALGSAVLRPERIAAATSTLYDLASLTKPIAGSCLAAVLSSEGRLSCDDPLSRHLREWSPPGDAARVTLLDLLTHRSGLPAWRPVYIHASGRDEYLEWLKRLPLDRPPGERVVYSDPGYILLGFALERAGGAPLHRLFAEKVARPLALRDLLYRPPRSLRRRIAATEAGNRRERVLAGTEGDGYNGWRTGVAWGEVHDLNARALGGSSAHAGLFGTARAVFLVAREILGPGGSGRSSDRPCEPLRGDPPVPRPAPAPGPAVPVRTRGGVPCAARIDPRAPRRAAPLNARPVCRARGLGEDRVEAGEPAENPAEVRLCPNAG